MENRLKDVAVAIGDISVLPVEADGVSAAVPMPEAYRSVSRTVSSSKITIARL
jgi:hypothetical protein